MSETDKPQYATFSGSNLSNRGRKVDTWKFSTLNSSVDVEVTMRNVPGEGYEFVASSASDLLPESISNADISTLRTEVENALDAVLAQRDEDNWIDGLGISVEVTDDGGYAGGPDYGRDTGGVRLSINRQPLRVQARTLRSNSGEVTVLARGRTANVRERRGDEIVPTDPDGKLPFRLDADIARTVLEDTQESNEKLDRINEVIARFAKQLQSRFNPDELHARGIPDLVDVQDIMDQVIEEMKDKPTFGHI